MIKTFRGWSDGAASICFIPSRRFRVSRPAHRKAACPGENRMTRDSGIFSAKKRKKSGPAKKKSRKHLHNSKIGRTFAAQNEKR